jgi:hypothetical protein
VITPVELLRSECGEVWVKGSVTTENHSPFHLSPTPLSFRHDLFLATVSAGFSFVITGVIRPNAFAGLMAKTNSTCFYAGYAASRLSLRLRALLAPAIRSSPSQITKRL